MKITIIGTGYVGLVSGICLASLEHQVICVDKDEAKIQKLKQNNIPIFENGLQEVLIKNQKNISFTSDLKSAIKDSQVIFIAVGTPQDEDGSADLSYVISAVKEIAKYAENEKLIITKSTVPVGTAALIKNILKEENSKTNFLVASNPEFLREGSALEDFMHPDRIVIGADDEKSKNILLEIYQNFGKEKIICTDTTTAELIKYASNSFLATKISFINEMADLCEKTGGNIKELSCAIGLDSRIGPKFLNPGPGFGGSCFPKDIKAILNIAKEKNVDLSVIASVVDSNFNRQNKMVEKIIKNLGEKKSIKDKKIALLGLAFKANTDDIRYSPAISIAKRLLQEGLQIKASDPEAIENSKKEFVGFENISFFVDAYEAIKDADLIVIATEWNEYKNLDLNKIKQITKSNKIVDLRNLLDAKTLKNQGFQYDFIGKKEND